jgi:hypothetical protein
MNILQKIWLAELCHAGARELLLLDLTLLGELGAFDLDF